MHENRDEPDDGEWQERPWDPELEDLARLIAPIVNGADGKVDPAARLAAELRMQEGRHAVLDQLILALVPPAMSPTLWQRWLKGGRPPVTRGHLQKVIAPGKAQSQKLLQASGRVNAAARRAERAREDLDAAEARLDRARQLEAALLQQAVTTHLVEVLAPIFALGPASVIMHAIRAELSPEELAVEVEGVAEKDLEYYKDLLLKDLARSSQQIQDGLARHADDYDFRRDIRDAISGVIHRYNAKA
jgi:hypothetical protein